MVKRQDVIDPIVLNKFLTNLRLADNDELLSVRDIQSDQAKTAMALEPALDLIKVGSIHLTIEEIRKVTLVILVTQDQIKIRYKTILG